MKRALLVVHDTILAVLVELLSLVLAPFVPVVVLFAKWDREPTTFTGGADELGWPEIRGDLPRWAYIWGTPDERLPCDLRTSDFHAQLLRLRWRFGARVARYLVSVRWLLRNRMYGLTWLTSARPSDGDLEPSPEPGIVWHPTEGIWRWWARLGPLALHVGWKCHRADEKARWDTGPFVAVRFVSLRRAR
jgi:hypothetical protein